jgi:hypothetical protein
MSSYPSIHTTNSDVTRPGDMAGVQRVVHTDVQRVVVTDVQMPFGSMVTFIVKWTIAAIPALLILFFIFAVLSALMAGFVTSLMRS